MGLHATAITKELIFVILRMFLLKWALSTKSAPLLGKRKRSTSEGRQKTYSICKKIERSSKIII
ncbi:hypothetical protein DRQ12_01150 [candidate division KSB1 bacterium]|nr:MAG: hypothetical protein DRQ12_01150 [candidate division KSB1 bacterium]